MSNSVMVPVDELIVRVFDAFVAARTSRETAIAVATALVEAEVDD